MVVTLAHGPEAGELPVHYSSLHFKDTTSSMSQHSIAAFSDHDSPSSAAVSHKRRSTFKTLVRATTLSKMMGKLSSHNLKRDSSTGAFGSSRHNNHHTKKKTDPRRRSVSRTRPFFFDPNARLQSVLTAEMAPFLHARINQLLPAQVYTLHDFDMSAKLLQEGDFYETHAATLAKHCSSPQTRQEPYRIKVLHHSVLLHHHPSDEIALERAALKMMMEGLYLAHLSHPGIVKLRGHNREGLDTIKHEQPEQFFFVTNQLGETLSQRLDSWKRWAAARVKEEQRRRHRAKYPAPLVPNKRDNPDTAILKDRLIHTYPEDLFVLKVNYALQILNALHFIHERGIVVRELRPDAIAFGDYPHHHTVQLCDLSSCREIPRGSKYIPHEGEWKTMLLKSSPSTLNLMLDEAECSLHDVDDITSSQFLSSQFLSPVFEDDNDATAIDDNGRPEARPSHSERSIEVQQTHFLADPKISFTPHEPEPSEISKPQPTHHRHEYEGVEAQPSSSGISLHHLASGSSYVTTDEVTHYRLSDMMVVDTMESQDDGLDAKNPIEQSLLNSKQKQKESMPDMSEVSISTEEDAPSYQSQSSQENNAPKSSTVEQETMQSSAPDASFVQAALVKSLETVNEDEDEQSFFEESERSSDDEPTKEPRANGDHEYHSEDNKSTASTGSHSSNQNNNSCDIFGVCTNAAARRYMAPDLFTGIGEFAKQGYNAQADIYSWAMIFTELLTESRPYGSRQLRNDWNRIVLGALRPNIKKHHFPRAVQFLLEQAWQACPEKRGSAAQLSKPLERILVMLEGQQNPWDNTLAGEVSVPEMERMEQTPSVLALLKKSSEKDEEIINQGPTLPERAAKYKRWMSRQPQKWSNIWDPRSTRKTKAEEEELQAAVQGKKEDLFAKRIKANAVQGI